MEHLSTERIARALSGISLVRRIEYLPTISSTNDVAKQLGVEGAPEATLVIADEQTAGRGRLGRAWWTPPGTAIAMSLLLRPKLPPTLAYRLTMLTGLVAVEAIEQVTSLKIGLKWPNDIMADTSTVPDTQYPILKLGGILTETSVSGSEIEYAVVGLGLNVNVDFSAREDLPEATSLMMQLGREVNRLDLLRALIERFAVRYAVIDHDDHLHNDWAARLVMLGLQIVARRGEESIAGLAEGVDESGALLIRQDDGALRRIDAADVTLRGASPQIAPS